MESRTLVRVLVAAGLVSAVGAFGCSLAQDESAASSPDAVVATGDTSAVLKSTLVLQGGCTAAKVGPKQLLLAARCVSNNPVFAVGNALVFTSAASGMRPAAAADLNADPSPVADGDAGPDASADDASTPKVAVAIDAGASAGARSVTIADVQINPSFSATCKDGVCGFDTLAASDAPDIAVIVLTDELTTVPSVPVDLDPVGQGDALLVVNSGCPSLFASPIVAPKVTKTIAVPATSVSYAGSPYESSPSLTARLASSYVVTAGVGWRTGAPRLCTSDIGAPLFRGGSAAVAGVTANYTTYAGGTLPVTTHHTRVDAASRFKIGDWLTSLGVSTTHSCSETAGGCVKHGYDGGAPPASGDGTTQPGDGGTDPIAPDASASDGGGTTDGTEAPHGDRLPSDPGDGTSDGTDPGDDYTDAAAPAKKKSTPKSGCSAAPGGAAPKGEAFLAVGLALAVALVRRRRAAR